MKISHSRWCAAVAAATIALAPGVIPLPGVAGQAQAQTRVSINVFFDSLAPHGRWLRTSRHGFVFVPVGIAANWRPYTEGRWVYTADYGWCWVSDEPFGWATYHYGRWGYDDDYGWFWVPGSRWAPAWVRWTRSDDYIGWAPLPPVGTGYATGYTVADVDVGIGAWRFVRITDFLAPRLSTVIVEPRRYGEILRVARPAGAVRVVRSRVVNTAIDVDVIERVVNRRVEVHRIVDRRGRPDRIRVEGNTVQAFRPTVDTRARAEPRRAAEARDLRNRIEQVQADAPARGRRGNDRDDGAATGRGDGEPGAVPGRKGPDARGPDAKGRDAKGPDAKGPVAKGQDAKGPDAKGPDAKGRDARGPDAKGRDAKGPDAKGRDDRDRRTGGVERGRPAGAAEGRSEGERGTSAPAVKGAKGPEEKQRRDDARPKGDADRSGRERPASAAPGRDRGSAGAGAGEAGQRSERGQRARPEEPARRATPAPQRDRTGPAGPGDAGPPPRAIDRGAGGPGRGDGAGPRGGVDRPQRGGPTGGPPPSGPRAGGPGVDRPGRVDAGPPPRAMERGAGGAGAGDGGPPRGAGPGGGPDRGPPPGAGPRGGGGGPGRKGN